MSHTYSHLYQLPTTGLRFFTVYGPWGRPDMALFKFTRAMIAGEAIDVYNQGQMKRDFTYIDDIAEAIVRLQDVIPQQDDNWTVETGSPATSSAPYRVYNIGNSQPVTLMNYIEAIEKALGITAKKNLMPMQPGDVLETSADTEALFKAIGFKPQTGVEEALKTLWTGTATFTASEYLLKRKKGSSGFLFYCASGCQEGSHTAGFYSKKSSSFLPCSSSAFLITAGVRP